MCQKHLRVQHVSKAPPRMEYTRVPRSYYYFFVFVFRFIFFVCIGVYRCVCIQGSVLDVHVWSHVYIRAVYVKRSGGGDCAHSKIRQREKIGEREKETLEKSKYSAGTEINCWMHASLQCISTNYLFAGQQRHTLSHTMRSLVLSLTHTHIHTNTG